MLRIGIVLLLVCASAQVMAQNGRSAAPDACSVAGDDAGGASDAAMAPEPKAAATRSRYAKPAAVPGGGGEERVLTRTRGSKWHSFLPGMFR